MVLFMMGRLFSIFQVHIKKRETSNCVIIQNCSSLIAQKNNKEFIQATKNLRNIDFTRFVSFLGFLVKFLHNRVKEIRFAK